MRVQAVTASGTFPLHDETDLDALRAWHDGDPHVFAWLALRGGSHILVRPGDVQRFEPVPMLWPAWWATSDAAA